MIPAADAALAAALLAVDPEGLGGAVLRARAGPLRDRWTERLRTMLDRPLRRLPASIDAARLEPGTDLTATLAAGRRVEAPGLLAEAAGSALLVPMAERLDPGVASRLGAAAEDGRLALVALDEGEPDEAAPSALLDRLAFLIALDAAEGPAAEGLPADAAEPAPVDLRAPDARSVHPDANAGRGANAVRQGAGAEVRAAGHAAELGAKAMEPNAGETRERLAAGLGAAASGTAGLGPERLAVAGREPAGPREEARSDEVGPRPRALAAKEEGGAGPGAAAPLREHREGRGAERAGLLEAAFEPTDTAASPPCTAGELAAPRRALADVGVPGPIVEALTAAAVRLGIGSLRAPVLAVRTARAAAALAGRRTADDTDAAVAARLVLGPRATRLPAEYDVPPQETADEAPPPDAGAPDTAEGAPPEDLVLEAALASLPPDLLAALAGTAPRQARGGTAGGRTRSATRGRQTGDRPGRPTGGARLDIVATLRAAAPWQPLRQRERPQPGRLQVRASDFRLRRFRRPAETAAVFVVDASGSAALARLAEAKGAVELLLAEAYVRREQVALVAFRGTAATLVLPPTRAPARARRELAGLPGGGGTPLAAGLRTGAELGRQLRSRGVDPRLVILTDGAANIALDGAPGRERAGADALRVAREIGAAGLAAILIDTARRPQDAAARLAAAMGGRYLALPYADARALSRAAAA